MSIAPGSASAARNWPLHTVCIYPPRQEGVLPACLPASASATAATAARVCFHHHWSSSPNERGGFFQDECLGRNGGCSLLLQLLLWDCDKVSIITLAYSCGSESCGDTVACAAEQLCAVTLTSFELHQSTVMHYVCVGQINCTQSLLDCGW